jgi:hypothetical protein
MITETRAVVVPKLTRIALLGDGWKDQAVFGHWKEDICKASAALDVTGLSCLTMRGVQETFASLSRQSAILYSAMYSDVEVT